MTRYLPLFLVGAGFAPVAAGQASLSVTPAYAYITEQEPHGAFALRNEGTARVEVVASARYGVIESDAAGEATHLTLGEAGRMGNLAERLTFFPERLILEPGEERFVRYAVRDMQEVRTGAHIALMHYEMQERAAALDDQIPAVATELSIVYNLVAPVVLIKGFGAPKLEARVLELQDSTLTLLVTNTSAFPFVGGISVNSRGQPLGHVEGAIYTRRRLEIALRAAPDRGPLVLRFDGSYTGLSAATRSRLLVPAPLEITL